MKKSLIVLLLCFIYQQLPAQEQPVSSTIKSVTVFLEGAEVVREASFNIKAGNTTLVLSGLPATINPVSLQAEGTGNFTILSVSHEMDYQEEQQSNAQVSLLQEDAEKLQYSIDELEGALAAYQEEEKLLYENRKLGGNEQGVSVAQIKEAADFYRTRLKEIKLRQLETRNQIKKLKEESQKISNSLRELKAQKGTPTSKIFIKTDAPAQGKAVLRVSYLTENAGWFPAYDLRVKEVGEPLSLHYKAHVHQQSGEDWNKVKLVISTGNPETNINIPALNTQWVNFQENVYWQRNREFSGNNPGQVQGRVTDSEELPLPGVTVKIKDTTIGAVTDMNGNYSVSIPAGGNTLVFSFIGYETQEVPLQGRSVIDVKLQEDIRALEEVVVVGYGMEGRAPGVSAKREKAPQPKKIAAPDVAQVQNQITTEFSIAQPFTIPSDGKTQMVDMQQYNIGAFYQYFAAPGKEEAAFLTANLTDWESADLLAGEASLFFEGKYVGKTLIDPLQTQDTLEISLGKDKNVQVEREEVKDFNRSSFLGGRRKEERVYKISVRNAKQKPVQLMIRDRVPVSKTSEITVETQEISGADYNQETGLLQWVINLQPNTKAEKTFSYSIRYNPKRKIVFYENQHP